METLIDYSVHFIKFPTGKVKETVVENEDGSFTIFIDKELNREMQEEAFSHAMKHILGDDFSKDNVNAIEFDAHSA